MESTGTENFETLQNDFRNPQNLFGVGSCMKSCGTFRTTISHFYREKHCLVYSNWRKG